MEGRKNPPPSTPRPKSKSPAERSEEFAATQARLKQEANDRRAAAKGGKDKK
jgi:hypothetical protein